MDSDCGHPLVSLLNQRKASLIQVSLVNYPEPGKRSLSSTVPTVVENADGSLYTVLGGSGGSRIFPAVFQVLLNLDWGMDISEAIEYGRVHDQLYPLYLDADSTYPKDILDELRLRHHNVTGTISKCSSARMHTQFFF